MEAFKAVMDILMKDAPKETLTEAMKVAETYLDIDKNMEDHLYPVVGILSCMIGEKLEEYPEDENEDLCGGFDDLFPKRPTGY